ncbi:MAG: hypothetical protein ABI091_23130 [Ferruginibacter sp.]
MFSITRIYADANGDSHFEDISIPLTDAGDIGFLSEKIPLQELFFVK